MNQTLIALLLLTGSLRAQTVGEDGLPVGGRLDVNVTMSGAAPDTDKAFVGHYGLIFKYSEGLTTRARMEGPVEIIEIFPSKREAPMKEPGYGGIILPQPFNPKPEDWRPENFSRLELTQLVIMPLSVSKYATLDDMIADKKSAMESAGLAFEAGVRKEGDMMSALFPPGTHWVITKRPYCLEQTYYRSKSLTYILSSGCGALERSASNSVMRAVAEAVYVDTPRPPDSLQASSSADSPYSWPSLKRTLPVMFVEVPVMIYSLLIMLPFALMGAIAPGTNFPYVIPALIAPTALFLIMMPSFRRAPSVRHSYQRSIAIHIVAALSAGSTAAILLSLLAWSFVDLGWSIHFIARLIILALTAHMLLRARRTNEDSWLDISWRIVLPAILMSALIPEDDLAAPITTTTGFDHIATSSLLVTTVVCAMLGFAWGALSKRPCRPF